MKDIYSENRKKIIKETEDHTNKWKGMCSWIKELKLLKCPCYPKQSSSSIRIKIPTVFFT